MPTPAEHCGHQPDPVIGQPTECVLRPGHFGSHANEDGMRWWKHQPEGGHCGWTEFHVGHPFLRLEVLFQCPGTAGTQPEPAQPRHTADSITDDALAALYDDLDRSDEVQGEMNETAINLTRDLARAEQRAETAEAERDAARNTLDRVRDVADGWATTAQRYPDSRLSTATVAYIIRTALDPHQTQETT
ncbi:hypothetical protein ACIPQA_16320 [Streptomyces sp. NPDC090109]|uniref:hypothetical protein n=1 Tax=Streptomyces sp. NPDC090109 TaxID=3365948 RepID=UPI00382183BF